MWCPVESRNRPRWILRDVGTVMAPGRKVRWADACQPKITSPSSIKNSNRQDGSVIYASESRRHDSKGSPHNRRFHSRRLSRVPLRERPLRRSPRNGSLPSHRRASASRQKARQKPLPGQIRAPFGLLRLPGSLEGPGQLQPHFNLFLSYINLFSDHELSNYPPCRQPCLAGEGAQDAPPQPLPRRASGPPAGPGLALLTLLT